jgi:4-aminobutyrate aminotransferase
MASLSPLLKQATPVLVEHAQGVYVYEENDRRYLDFTAGIGVVSTGHCHPKVVAAAQQQVGKLVHGQYTTVMHRPLLALTERLGDVLPAGLDTVFYANSGSEAIESALRLARQATGRPNVIVFQGSFHGRTVGAASLTTSGTRFRSGYAPLMGGVHVAPFPYAFHYGWDERTTTEFALRELDYLLATLTPANDTAAMFVEPMLGEGGYVPANREFMAGLRERCDKHGILLVTDEVQTGFGRTGKFWGHDHFGVRPDVLVTAKGLASGFPLSLMAAPAALMTQAWPGSQGGTYGGNAVACAAALATLEVIEEEGLVENAAAMGRRLLDGTRAVADKGSSVGDVRGLGLLVGSEFTRPDGSPDAETAQRAQQAAAEKGLLLLTCGAWMNVVRMIPPLVVNSAQVDEACEIWSDVVASVTSS